MKKRKVVIGRYFRKKRVRKIRWIYWISCRLAISNKAENLKFI